MQVVGAPAPRPGVQGRPHLELYLPTSPYISLHLPASRCICPCLRVCGGGAHLEQLCVALAQGALAQAEPLLRRAQPRHRLLHLLRLGLRVRVRVRVWVRVRVTGLAIPLGLGVGLRASLSP